MESLPLDLITANVIPFLSIEEMDELSLTNHYCRRLFGPLMYPEFSRRIWAILQAKFETEYPMLWEIICLPFVVFTGRIVQSAYRGEPFADPPRLDIWFLDRNVKDAREILDGVFNSYGRRNESLITDHKERRWCVMSRRDGADGPSQWYRGPYPRNVNFDGYDVYHNYGDNQFATTKYMKIFIGPRGLEEEGWRRPLTDEEYELVFRMTREQGAIVKKQRDAAAREDEANY